MLVQPVPEHFQWCRKYYSRSSCHSRGSRKSLWSLESVINFLFTFSKNYAPWFFHFFISVWNCRATRNKSNASFTWKLLVYLRGALKFPLNLLFYKFNIRNSFKEASSVILSIPFTVLVSSALNVSHFVNITLKTWCFGLNKLRFNEMTDRVLSFSLLCAPISFLILYAYQCNQDQNEFSC